MTQGKHTPGPWTVQMQAKWPFGISIQPDIMQMCRVAYSTSHKSLDDVRAAVGFDHNQRDDISAMVAEQEANARLIAAAPDTLEALQATLDELLCVRDYIDDASRGQLRYRGESDLSEMAGSDLVRIDEAIAAARAAIARAT